MSDFTLPTDQELIQALREVNAEQKVIIIDLMLQLDNLERRRQWTDQAD